MPARIRTLNPETIGKIAAGEVVERPASVVKELLENAIDAGSRRVTVEIRSGGVEFIQVTDDGHGIAAEDLAVAVQRHATSKLSSFDDFDRLATLGFRGEALPSIGAVSILTLTSRQRTQPAGARLVVTFGDVEESETCSAPVGTSVTVRDLFGNVPARRKFLRQTSTESATIGRVVGAYAMASPEVAFSLINDGRRVFVTDGSGDAVSAAVAVIGPDVGGAILTLQPLDADAAIPGIDVAGWVAAPSISRSHRQGMNFFVNGRWIQNRPLAFAFEEAYHSLLTVGRHPLALVQLRLEPSAVDVNVHPTKAEVKFVDERSVCRAAQRAAHAALAAGPHARLPEIRFGTASAIGNRDVQLPAPSSAGAEVVWQGSQRHESSSVDNEESLGHSHCSGVPILRVLGQVAGTYIIAEGPDGMYLVDQHAAHERVMYERIKQRLGEQVVDRQPLLDPLVIDLAPDELTAFDRSRDELAQIGFEIDRFGDGAVILRAVPAIVRGVDIAERLRLILRELADGGTGESWIDAVAISAACHTSIRAGQSLSLQEMRELIAELERSSQPRACGHGRPTMLRLSQAELERQFARS